MTDATRPTGDPAGRFRRRPGIIETDLGGELILLDPATQEMFSLNATGRAVWQRVEGAPIDGIVEAVVAAFEVTRETAEADVRALLRRLLDAGLIVPAS